ncbi:MAG: hypothetical protein AAGB93_23745, partial [Planctomycetota bacterium]
GALLLVACGGVPPSREPPRLAVEPRLEAAATGADLAASLAALPLEEREHAIWVEAEAGNIPDFLRALVPVQLRAEVEGVERTATFWCTPDYLGFGRAGDWLRAPMTPALAERIADRFGAVLPTRRMVDAIWEASEVRLEPVPYSPTEHDITAFPLFHRHHLAIEEQRRGAPPGALVAGVKKDVVVSPLLVDAPGRVCIYGWHRPDGAPIQPLYRGHVADYVDYSHGVRLVAGVMTVDGERVPVASVLADPALHVLLSDEGPVSAARYSAPSRSTQRAEGCDDPPPDGAVDAHSDGHAR